MGKREDFLDSVRTLIVVNSVRLATEGEHTADSVANFSYTNAFNILSDAMYAADRIPDDLEVMDAVNDFCSYFFENIREQEPEGYKPQLPYWCARS